MVLYQVAQRTEVDFKDLYRASKWYLKSTMCVVAHGTGGRPNENYERPSKESLGLVVSQPVNLSGISLRWGGFFHGSDMIGHMNVKISVTYTSK
jgi:hypothetical protein